MMGTQIYFYMVQLDVWLYFLSQPDKNVRNMVNMGSQYGDASITQHTMIPVKVLQLLYPVY